MAGTHDPNYQVYGIDRYSNLPYPSSDTRGSGRRRLRCGQETGRRWWRRYTVALSYRLTDYRTTGPKAPAAGGMAGTHDPNYQVYCSLGVLYLQYHLQTLAAVGGDAFGADKKMGGGGGGGTVARAAIDN